VIPAEEIKEVARSARPPGGRLEHIKDYHIGFSPHEWTLFVPNMGTIEALGLLGISVAIGFV